MHRFYIPPEAWNLDALALDDSETHHAIDVLRMNTGDKAVVFNGRGAEATVEIAAVTRKSVTLRKLLHAKSAPSPAQSPLPRRSPREKPWTSSSRRPSSSAPPRFAPCLASAR